MADNLEVVQLGSWELAQRRVVKTLLDLTQETDPNNYFLAKRVSDAMPSEWKGHYDDVLVGKRGSNGTNRILDEFVDRSDSSKGKVLRVRIDGTSFKAYRANLVLVDELNEFIGYLE